MPSGGQNNKMTTEMTDKVLQMLMEGKSATAIVEALGIVSSTLVSWRERDALFEKAYSRAREVGFDAQADHLDIIAENTVDVQRARLMCDNVKWRLARVAPHKYGDRLDINVNSTVDIAAAIEEGKRRALSGSYQSTAEDAEVVETKALPSNETTGYKPVEDNKPQENEDAPEKSSEDIFS